MSKSSTTATDVLAGIVVVGLVILAVLALFALSLAITAGVILLAAWLFGVSITFWQALGVALIINILRSIFAPRTVVPAAVTNNG